MPAGACPPCCVAPGAPRLALSYDYDRQGRTTYRRAELAEGKGSFCWWYAYEARGLAREVFAQEGCAAGSQQSRPQTPEVSFAYNAAGQVENTIYKGGMQMPRSYHVRGWLKSIGTLDGSTPFGASYDYFDDGTLERQDWQQTKLGGGPKSYAYRYDALDRLESADYAENGLSGAYDVAGLGYDESGNITALKRRGASGALVDDLTYTYGAGESGRKSGRLTSIGDPAGSVFDWDATSGRFDYDRAGRLVEAPAPYQITAASYDERSLPSEHVLATGDTVRYRYSLEGERTYQRSGSGVPTRYLLGAGGANLGTIEGSSLESWNLALPSGSAIGRVTASGERRYYLKGHLGSVRTAIDASGVAKEARDYYPFGLRLRAGGEMAAEEDFTGHHRDAATGGLLYAGARYYMSALGRWTAPDPLADKYPGFSPYNYALNNPANLFDPDGRAPCCLLPPLGLAGMPDNVAAIAGSKEAQARVAKREGARLGLLSLFAPGPEDVLLAAAAGTRAGRAIAKFGDEAVGFAKRLLRGGDEAAGVTEEVRRAQKGIRSLKKRAAEHEKKLKDYAQNPDAHDNQGKLKDVPKEIREKIIEGRKRKLKREINTFRQNIRKLRRKIRDLREE